MTSEELITKLEPNKSNPYFKIGYLSGACKGAIIELETFLEHRKETLSQSDYNYIQDIINGLNHGLQETNNEKSSISLK